MKIYPFRSGAPLICDWEERDGVGVDPSCDESGLRVASSAALSFAFVATETIPPEESTCTPAIPEYIIIEK